MNKLVDSVADVATHNAAESAAERWARFKPIVTGEDYLDSLRGRNITCYLFGEQVPEPVDNALLTSLSTPS